ncbi:hypothetical protein BGW37DRAFT_477282 [Umbelopsis sp. PMI_123]|nr:hypothetical protein BGW37DRAFT_477282 [Umbelopsis sp. PMI_123]
MVYYRYLTILSATALVSAISLDDAVSKLHLALGDTIGKEYHHAHMIVDIPRVDDIKHWTLSVTNKALDENHQEINTNSLKDAHTLSGLAQLFRITPDNTDTYDSATVQSQDDILWTKKCREKGALAILDSVYDASLKVDDFNSSTIFDAHYTPTPMRKNLVQPAMQAAVYGSFAVATTAHSAGVSSSWLPVCDTDPIYVNAADRLIFFNTLAAGFQALSPDLYKAYTNASEISEGKVIKYVSRLSIQLHMLQSIAKAAHLDPNDDAVKTMIYLCTLGDYATTALSQTAKQIGEAVSSKLPNVIPRKVLDGINRKVANELIERSVKEENGNVVKLSQKVPGIRNFFDFVVDASSTWSIGKVAKIAFCPLPGSNDRAVEKPLHVSSEQHKQEL